MKLSANDLMLGNWVRFKGSDLYHQVHALQGKSVRLDKQYWYKADKLLPIPLTAEILEKNEFEEWDGWLIYSPEGTGIEIAWVGTILKIGGECGNLELPTIEYVHQLQNALTSCGIKKEITI